jgi:hypothetical protein
VPQARDFILPLRQASEAQPWCCIPRVGQTLAGGSLCLSRSAGFLFSPIPNTKTSPPSQRAISDAVSSPLQPRFAIIEATVSLIVGELLVRPR